MMNDSIIMSRKQLYDEIWNISVTGVAKKYNLNYPKLINICKEYNIPYPTSAYWTKKNIGMDISDLIVSLPDSEIKEITLYSKEYVVESINETIKVVNEDSENTEDSLYKNFKGLEFLNEDERKNVLKVIFNLDINKHKKAHKKLIEYKKKIEEKSNKENYNSRYYSKYGELNYLDNISKLTKERSSKILSCIYYTIEELGGKINDDLSMVIRNENVTMEISELQDQVSHELTKEEARELLEYQDKIRRNQYAWKTNIRKYDYIYNGKLKIAFESRDTIRDNEKFKLEDKIDEIMIKLYEKSERVRISREAWEERKRKEDEERRIKEELSNRKKEEALKVKKLLNIAEDYKTACEIRNYIEALSSKNTIDDKTKELIEWARKKADWFDPTIEVDDELLGKRKHEESKEDKNRELDRHTSYYSWY